MVYVDDPKDREFASRSIIPNCGEKVISPIFICPEDIDFWCTTIVVEVEVEIWPATALVMLTIPTFTWAQKAGMEPAGLEGIEIRGADLAAVQRKFARPTIYAWNDIRNIWGFKEV